jgi:hypothetical protein
MISLWSLIILEAFQKYRHLQRVQQGRGDVRLGRRLQVRIPYRMQMMSSRAADEILAVCE